MARRTSCLLALAALANSAVASVEGCIGEQCVVGDEVQMLQYRTQRDDMWAKLQQPSEPHIPDQLPPAMAGDMVPVDTGKLTNAGADDDVDVYVLWSPIMFETVGDLLGRIGLYHSGVGFKNRRTGLVSSTQFYANKFGLNLVVPEIDADARTMTWRRNASIAIAEGSTLNTGYWTGTQHVARVTGEVYNSFIRVEQERGAAPLYTLWNLAARGTRVSQPHLPWSPPPAAGFPTGSITCWDYVQEVLYNVQASAGTEAFIETSNIKRDDTYLWAQPGSTPRKMNMSNPEDYDRAFSFFNSMSLVVMRWAEKVGDDVTDGNESSSKSDLLQAFLMEAYKGVANTVDVDADLEYWEYTHVFPYGGYRVTTLSTPVPAVGAEEPPSMEQ